MLLTLEGTYKNGRVELLERPVRVDESRVLVTFLPVKMAVSLPRRMVYGQFAGERMSTEEDFRIAEWRGEAEDQDDD